MTLEDVDHGGDAIAAEPQPEPARRAMHPEVGRPVPLPIGERGRRGAALREARDVLREEPLQELLRFRPVDRQKRLPRRLEQRGPVKNGVVLGPQEGERLRRGGRRERTWIAGVGPAGHAANDFPQPHVPCASGFRKTNPCPERPEVKSSSVAVR